MYFSKKFYFENFENFSSDFMLLMTMKGSIIIYILLLIIVSFGNIHVALVLAKAGLPVIILHYLQKM